MSLIIKCREGISPISDGLHKGTILEVNERKTTEGYEYVDILTSIEDVKDSEGHPYSIKYSCPNALSPNTKLGKLIANFTELTPNKDYDIQVLLVNRDVTFMTLKEKKGDNEYSNIVPGSLKPVKE